MRLRCGEEVKNERVSYPLSMTRAATSSVINVLVSYCTVIDALGKENPDARVHHDLLEENWENQELTLHCDYVGDEERLIEKRQRRW